MRFREEGGKGKEKLTTFKFKTKLLSSGNQEEISQGGRGQTLRPGRPRQPPRVMCLVSVNPLLRCIERLLVTSPRS